MDTDQKPCYVNCVKDGVWRIPAEAREKGNAGELVLPKEAVAILDEMPRFASCPYVFTVSGRAPMSHHAKAAFDAKVKIEPWVIHDLRRTAKSLMARAGVRPDGQRAGAWACD